LIERVKWPHWPSTREAGPCCRRRKTILNDQYGKLSRVVYAYVAEASYGQRPEVREFVDYFVAGAGRFVQCARLVPLTDRNYQDALGTMKAAPQ
jgi:hypothetical protein